ncbi:uncharacterized protein isoform X2 [Danio rerio]
MKDDDQIQWRFGTKETLIAEINKQTNRFSVFDDVLDGRFRDRLKMDNKTGSLTITDTRTEHAGVYKAQTNNKIYTVKLALWSETEENKVFVEMGDSVTLNTDYINIMNDDRVQWRFGDGGTLIAEITKQTNRFSVFDDVLDGRFRDRLKLDKKTGSLTITNITAEHGGVYKLQTNTEVNSVTLEVYVNRKEVSVKTGESVTLHTGFTEIKDDDLIQWRFANIHSLIAEINKQTNRFSVFADGPDGRFRDRLKLDKKTGSLTITDITTEHAGRYKLQSDYLHISFYLTVFDEIQVDKGNSVTLSSGVSELRNDDQIQWRFGYKDTLIAEINKQTNSFSVFDDVLDGRFRDRLKLDNKTGSLIITDIITENAGDYKVQINTEINTVKLRVLGDDKEVSVKMRNSVTLSSGVSELKNDDQIQWRFGDEDTLIAEINVAANRFSVFDDVLDGRFRDRLKLDNKTGSLIIANTTTEHAGVYKLLTNYIIVYFDLIVYKEISVMEGDSVTLNSDLTKLNKYKQIEWRFGDEDTLIAKINKRTNSFSVFDDVLDGRFRDRLKLDNKTGFLIITDTRTKHAGVYELSINFKKIQSFILTVALPVPVLILNSSQCSSSSSSSVQYCSVLCSVVNVSAVSLSWYKGNSLLSSISVSDLSISLSLPLEVEYQEKNTYSCVINNTISNQTQHLDISQLCPTCSGSVHCCGPTEAAIRLVLSALVGVATVIIVLYDIRSRRAEQDQAHIHASQT